MLAIDDLLDLAAIQRMDEVCDQFEQSLQSGQPLTISTIIEGWAQPERGSLVRELIFIEQDYNLRHDRSGDRAHYEAMLPDDVDAVKEAFRTFEELDELSTDGSLLDTAGLPVGAGKDELPLPSRIGRYEIDRQIASGGFGVVLLGRDPDLNRPVAIKRLISGRLQTDAAWEMLRREAELAAKVKHPAVVGIYDIGREASGRPYFVMEYVEGESLRDRLQDGPLGTTEAVRLAKEIAEGVEHIHRCGLVHRDLKPANVLIDEQGTPKIADLGLAIEGGESDDQLAGTYFYMAPEQLQIDKRPDENGQVDPRCDIWALGVMLYEMLTGRRPFVGTTRRDVAQQIQTAAPAPPHDLNSRIPEDLSHLCIRCLAKDPAARLASSGELAEALRQLELDDVTESASKRTVQAVALAVLCGLLVTAMLVWMRRPPVTGGDAVISPAANVSPSNQSDVPAADVDQETPFVDATTGGRFADLHAAVEAIDDEGVIEIDADGPLLCDMVRTGARQLTIKAAEGRKPILSVADPAQHFLMRCNGDLVLEDLAFKRQVYLGPKRVIGPSLVVVGPQGRLQATGCQFIFDSAERAACVRGDRCEMELVDCQFTSGGSAIHWSAARGLTLAIENCVARGRSVLVVLANEGDSLVKVSRTTVDADEAFICAVNGGRRDVAPIQLEIIDSRLHVDAVMRCTVMGPASYQDGIWTGPFRWQGSENQFVVRETFLRMGAGNGVRSAGIDNQAAWQQWWNRSN